MKFAQPNEMNPHRRVSGEAPKFHQSQPRRSKGTRYRRDWNGQRIKVHMMTSMGVAKMLYLAHVEEEMIDFFYTLKKLGIEV